MYVRIGEYGSLGLDVQRNDARTAERFHPPLKASGPGQPANFANQFGFDPLTLQWRNQRRNTHSVSSSGLAGSSAASWVISFSWAFRISIPLFLYSRYVFKFI